MFIVRPASLELSPEASLAQEAVLQCYRAHSTRTLDCWKEIEDLKRIAQELEKKETLRWAS